MDYQEIKLPKAVVYLTKEELHHLLLLDMSLYREALIRGKSFTRANTLEKRIEGKKQAEQKSEGHIH